MTEQDLQKALDSKFEGLQSDFTDVQAKLQEAQKNGATKEEVQKLHALIEKSGTAIEDFMESQKKTVVNSVAKQFNTFLNEKSETIEELRLKGAGTILFTPKAVGDLSTGSGTDVGTAPAVLHANLNTFNFRDDSSLLALATTTSTNAPALSYTEQTPKEGGYEFVAEAGTKPQTDFKWENRFIEPKKAAAYEVMSEEVVTDVARMESVAREYLEKTHNLFKANNLFFGPGTGVTPTGATVSARTFVATGMANVFPAGTSNFMDVVNAIITDIYRTQTFTDEASYMPNIVLINPIDFFIQLVGAKDGQGLPLYPQAGLFNEVRIGGVIIKPWIKIPAGKIFVADMTKMNVINYVPFSIRIGWINDQFITNQFTMVGESRYYQYIKNLDLQAFVYDDIATVQAAITAA